MEIHPSGSYTESANPASTGEHGDLTLLLTLFSGIALLALYAVQLIMGGLRETVNA